MALYSRRHARAWGRRAWETILANPLADLLTLGVSAAATVGASVAIVFGWSVVPGAGPFIVTANAFVFALSASLVLFFMTKLRGVSAETMISGRHRPALHRNAITELLQYRSNEVQLTQIVFWTLGSLARATWGKAGVAAVLIAVAPALLPDARLGADGAQARRRARREHGRAGRPPAAGDTGRDLAARRPAPSPSSAASASSASSARISARLAGRRGPALLPAGRDHRERGAAPARLQPLEGHQRRARSIR